MAPADASTATPAAGASPRSAKTCGEPAVDVESAPGTIKIFEASVPTNRSPFGAKLSSRAPATFAMTSNLSPFAIVGRAAGTGGAPAGVCGCEEPPPPQAVSIRAKIATCRLIIVEPADSPLLYPRKGRGG